LLGTLPVTPQIGSDHALIDADGRSKFDYVVSQNSWMILWRRKDLQYQVSYKS